MFVNVGCLADSLQRGAAVDSQGRGAGAVEKQSDSTEGNS